MPVYYRNKIYDDEERERLWLHKLDEKVRYVDGVKVDVSDGEDEYVAVREEARAKNLRLGYGTDETGRDEKEYMKRIRYVKHITDNVNSGKVKEKKFVDVQKVNNFDNVFDRLNDNNVLNLFNDEI